MRAHVVPRFYLRGFAAERVQPHHEPALWVGYLATGQVRRHAPKNLGVVSDFYSGRGGLEQGTGSLEQHLARVEGAAATELRRWLSLTSGYRHAVPATIMRFVAWLAARTSPMSELFRLWLEQDLLSGIADKNLLGEILPGASAKFPDGRVVLEATVEELTVAVQAGATLKLDRQATLEMVHLQAWHFQDRLFPLMEWMVLDAPPGHTFITSDRPVVWIADGLSAEARPAWLRHPAVQLFAPLSSSVALLAQHESVAGMRVTVADVNGAVAMGAQSWVAGPDRQSVEQVLHERCDQLPVPK